MSPRPRREDALPHLATEIKATARQQMAEHGTAGLSLRGIARTLGISAPAIYHYYPRLDNLITALIVDAYASIAEAMEAAAGAATHTSWHERFLAAALAYRTWALDHPIEYQLIYGNPIPGYAAPAAVTQPLARRPFFALGEHIFHAWQAGELHLPLSESDLPQAVVRHLTAWQAEGLTIPIVALYILVIGWTRLHGLVSLELFNHLQALLGDTGAAYSYEVTRIIEQFGAPRA